MNQPNLPALIALEALARLGNVTRAAAELHVTQSAVSHRLRNLQEELGVPLLERDGRGVKLTAAGQELARATEGALEQLQQAIVRLTPAARDRVLSISCSPSFAIRFLVPRLSAFRSAHPDYDLRIASADVPVEPGHGADAAIILRSRPRPGLRCEKLVDEVVFPVASPRLLENGPPLRVARDVLSFTLLHDEALTDDPGRIDWRAWFGHASLPSALIRNARSVRFSHAYLALEAALAGDGIALARRSLVADDLQRGRLVAPLIDAMPSGVTYWFATAVTPERPAIALLRSFVSQQLTAAANAADRVRVRRANTRARAATKKALRKASGHARRSKR
jgi:LysR family glycine cleavage system transcriptional activator